MGFLTYWPQNSERGWKRYPHPIKFFRMDSACFREWARLMERQPQRLLEDVMIAATARIQQLTVATRNERDFASLGVSS